MSIPILASGFATLLGKFSHRLFHETDPATALVDILQLLLRYVLDPIFGAESGTANLVGRFRVVTISSLHVAHVQSLGLVPLILDLVERDDVLEVAVLFRVRAFVQELHEDAAAGQVVQVVELSGAESGVLVEL